MATKNNHSSEPKRLRDGKRFHKLIQEAWKDPSDPTFGIEKYVRLEWPPNSARKAASGRIDVVFGLKDGSAICLFEIKATNWGRVQNVTRVLGSHRRQLLKYVDQFLFFRDVSVVASMIYPSRPSDSRLASLIEDYMAEWAIQVMWYHEQ